MHLFFSDPYNKSPLLYLWPQYIKKRIYLEHIKRWFNSKRLVERHKFSYCLSKQYNFLHAPTVSHLKCHNLMFHKFLSVFPYWYASLFPCWLSYLWSVQRQALNPLSSCCALSACARAVCNWCAFFSLPFCPGWAFIPIISGFLLTHKYFLTVSPVPSGLCFSFPLLITSI